MFTFAVMVADALKKSNRDSGEAHIAELERKYKRILPDFEDKMAVEVTSDDLEDWLED